MAASQPSVRRRRRPRRGSLARPINGRLYRDLGARRPDSGAAARVHGRGAGAAREADPARARSTRPRRSRSRRDLVHQLPEPAARERRSDRRRELVHRPAADRGLRAADEHVSTWKQRVPGLGHGAAAEHRRGRARAQSPEAIVVMAHRDDIGRRAGRQRQRERHGGADRARPRLRAAASDGSAPVTSARTIVFLSTDGGAFGGLGAAHFLADSPFRKHIVAVDQPRRDRRAGRAGHRDRRRHAALAEREPRRDGGRPRRRADGRGAAATSASSASCSTSPSRSRSTNRARSSPPGIPAVTITTGGDRPPPALRRRRRGDSTRSGSDSSAPPRSSCSARSTTGLELAPSTRSYVWVGGRFIRGWAIELLLVALLVPFAVAVVDLYALCRRQRISLAPAGRCAAQPAPVLALRRSSFSRVFACSGAWPSGPATPPNPGTRGRRTTGPSEHSRRCASILAARLGARTASGWPSAGPSRPRRSSPATRSRSSRCSSSALLVIAADEPVRAPLRRCRRCTSGSGCRRSGSRAPRSASALFALGLAGPALLLVSLGWRYGLGLDAPWYLLELVGDRLRRPRRRSRSPSQAPPAPASSRPLRPAGTRRTRTRASAARAGPSARLVRSIVARDPRRAPGAARDAAAGLYRLR